MNDQLTGIFSRLCVSTVAAIVSVHLYEFYPKAAGVLCGFSIGLLLAAAWRLGRYLRRQ
jgi:hypothetical protein